MPKTYRVAVLGHRDPSDELAAASSIHQHGDELS
jgi:hypothetical protein